jgi:HPt (histidine-containing phosphotransfer) domain-containing protein
MSQELLDQLKAAGCDVDGALDRFMGNQALYEKFLFKFLDDDNFIKVLPSFEKKDYQGALESTHTIKGVAGNLGLTRLYNAASNTVALIRANEQAKAEDSYKELASAYNETTDIIKKHK